MNSSTARKPSLLLYCQHSVGMGHLMRSMVLAQALARDYRVVFLNGGPMPADFVVPSSVEVIDLPPLGMDDGHTLVSRDAATDIAAAKHLRRARVLELFHQLKPAVLVIELFPFGRKKFAFELLPLLKCAKRERHRSPVILCSVRDILVQDRPDQQLHDNRAAWLCDRYFDAVLVHADPQLAQFSESFRPKRPLRTPVHYTGFVARESEVLGTGQRDDHILVSAGGGIAGGPLFRAVVDAHKQFGHQHGRKMRLVAGPFLPEPEWLDLQQRAASCDRLELIRSVPDLTSEMHRAALSVSQCGYNTAMDILISRIPALVIPYAEKRENEQTNRARRLADRRLLRVLEPDGLTPHQLFREIIATLDFVPSTNALMLNGGDCTARVVSQLMRASTRQQNTQAKNREIDHVA